jgi:homogentisate 1,2-dioxygenase
MANRRDFKTPVAAFEDREVPSTVTVKWCGQFHVTEIGHSPLDVVAWHGNYAPVKYDLTTYCPVGAILFDHPDPSIFTVLTAPSGVPGRPTSTSCCSANAGWWPKTRSARRGITRTSCPS